MLEFSLRAHSLCALLNIPIRFYYLYRDANNYKHHHSVTFSNSCNGTLEEIDFIIRQNLIEGEWFDHAEWNLPDLHFDTFNPETDHSWHEYSHVAWCDDVSGTVHGTIEEFMHRITRTKAR